MSPQIRRLTHSGRAARAHNIELSIYRVARGEEIAAAIDSAQASGATALNVLSSGLFYAHRQLIMERVAALHLPAIYALPERLRKAALLATGRVLVSSFQK